MTSLLVAIASERRLDAEINKIISLVEHAENWAEYPEDEEHDPTADAEWQLNRVLAENRREQ